MDKERWRRTIDQLIFITILINGEIALNNVVCLHINRNDKVKQNKPELLWTYHREKWNNREKVKKKGRVLQSEEQDYHILWRKKNDPNFTENFKK